MVFFVADQPHERGGNVEGMSFSWDVILKRWSSWTGLSIGRYWINHRDEGIEKLTFLHPPHYKSCCLVGNTSITSQRKSEVVYDMNSRYFQELLKVFRIVALQSNITLASIVENVEDHHLSHATKQPRQRHYYHTGRLVRSSRFGVVRL